MLIPILRTKSSVPQFYCFYCIRVPRMSRSINREFPGRTPKSKKRKSQPCNCQTYLVNVYPTIWRTAAATLLGLKWREKETFQTRSRPDALVTIATNELTSAEILLKFKADSSLLGLEEGMNRIRCAQKGDLFLELMPGES